MHPAAVPFHLLFAHISVVDELAAVIHSQSPLTCCSLQVIISVVDELAAILDEC